ncbi:Uncharacterised protein [Enterobacter ludwigii]|nr:Uncharacterised protein [Enterobacter ludwigii]
MANVIHDLASVIDGAIVGTQLDHRQAERTRVAGTARRHFGHQLTQIILLEAVGVDAANKAVRVTCGFQIDRRCARLKKCSVVVGFMVVAIEQDQVARSEKGVEHHFVGR